MQTDVSEMLTASIIRTLSKQHKGANGRREGLTHRLAKGRKEVNKKIQYVD
jgi:hypothetical protein